MPAQVKGAFPEAEIHTVQVDKHGIISAVLKRKMKLSLAGGGATWLEALRDIPDSGLPLTGIQYSVEHGVASIDYSYEGLDANYTFDTEARVSYELDGSESDDPAKSHPNWDYLKDTYGWDEEKEHFPEYLPDNSGSSSSLTKGKTRENGKSDLAGTDTYLNAGAIFRRTRALMNVPGDAMTGVGTIVKEPPGFDYFNVQLPTKRNWLKLAPKIKKRGNCVEFSEEYMLSGPNGWNEDIYGQAQLET